MRNEVIHGILIGLALVVAFVTAGSMIARPLSHPPPSEQAQEAPAEADQADGQQPEQDEQNQ